MFVINGMLPSQSAWGLFLMASS